MTHLMHDAHGVGLAATQVGVLQRLFVFQLADDEDVTTIVNPAITKRSRSSGDRRGGLPLAPGRAGAGRAALEVTLEGQDVTGAALAGARGHWRHASSSTRSTTSTGC